MKDCFIEVCVDSVESAIEAVQGGASRLELCSNLIIGGTSPSTALFKQIRQFTTIPIHVLLRPRFGDFCYTSNEFQIMLEEVQIFKSLGANGIVIGILNKDGSLDVTRMKQLIDIAGDMKITLHRAFDMSNNPIQTLQDAISLSIDLILTSGQEENCVKGSSLLEQLVKESKNKIRIMAGSGLHADNAEYLYLKTGIKDFHLSGKITTDSKMIYRKKGVSMGLPSMSEYEIWQTDAKNIQNLKEVLEQLPDVR